MYNLIILFEENFKIQTFKVQEPNQTLTKLLCYVLCYVAHSWVSFVTLCSGNESNYNFFENER